MDDGTIASLGRWKLNKFKPHWDRQDERTEGRGKIVSHSDTRKTAHFVRWEVCILGSGLQYCNSCLSYLEVRFRPDLIVSQAKEWGLTFALKKESGVPSTLSEGDIHKPPGTEFLP
jgi:hypothetical protein